ncbi:MAG: hypothetical protein JST26_16015 [Bacteroidetes bacterium]|nr:hypothetical protein [Bacteroidota bacterium]
MYRISDQQIDFMLDDIRARGVEMESLQQNLLDHVCCIIEQNLDANGDFESFYQKTIRTFYKDALWEIEEETISLLTFKNYYTMKKVMIISGTFSAAATSAGIFFKFMHWPGASALLVLGIAVASFLFLPLLFTLKAKEKTKTRDKIIIGLGTIAAILLSLGILFKIMHWPGANMMGVLMISVMLLLFIPIYFFTGIRNPETKVNTIVFTILAIMGCGLFLALVNSRPSIQIHAAENSNQHYETTYLYATEQVSLNMAHALKDTSVAGRNLEKLHSLCNSICTQIEQLKSNAVTVTDYLDPEHANENAPLRKINYAALINPDNYDLPTAILFGGTQPDAANIEARPALVKLKQDLKLLNEMVLNTYKRHSEVLIDLSDKNDIRFAHPVSWEVTNFYHTPLSNLLVNFTQLQINVRLVEATCIH